MLGALDMVLSAQPTNQPTDTANILDGVTFKVKKKYTANAVCPMAANQSAAAGQSSIVTGMIMALLTKPTGGDYKNYPNSLLQREAKVTD